MATKLLEEIEALDDARDDNTDAQQRFHALVFPARHGAQVIKHLTAEFGSLVDLGFPHLKRMKKHEMLPQQLIALIVPASSGGESGDSTVPLNDAQVTILQDTFGGSLCTVDVLKRGPKTREACENHTKNWPLIFHASVAPETQLDLISDSEAQQMKLLVQQAVAVGQRYGEQQQQQQTDGRAFCCARGCVIGDPNSSGDAVYAVAADSNCHLNSDASYSFQTLFHPVMVALDRLANRDQERGGGGPSKKPRRAEDHSPHQEPATTDDAAPSSYLCTGYDIFVDVEPCVMCAMALVHSRARRVIFATRNATDGALVSVHRLHTIKSLNHHYRAFQFHLDPTEPC